MSRRKKTKIPSRKLALAVSSLALGSLLGYLSARSAVLLTREPSSVSAAHPDADLSSQVSRNDYALLPCADEASMKRYMSELKVKQAPQGEICGDASPYEKLGKLLRFMEESRFAEALPGFGGFRAAGEPFKFVGGLVNAVNFSGFDRSAVADSVAAYNRNGDVFVGPRVLDLPPITAAMVLLHEAHHSEATDPRHVTCAAGDRPGQQGACDAAYSSRAGMGAYSVSVQVHLAIASFGLNFSEADREFARASAMGTLDARFNALPAEQAALDALMMLDDAGRVRLLHPLARTLMAPLELSPALGEGDHLRQILEASGGQLCARSSLGSLRCGKRVSAWRDPLSVVKGAESLRARDYRMLVADQTLPYLLTEKNEMALVKIDPEDGKEFVKHSSYKPQAELKKFVSGLGFRRFALSRGGEVYPFTDRLEDFTVQSFAEDEKGLGYADAMGGFLSSELWMIQNSSGRLLYWNRRSEKVEASRMQCPEGALQYVEGATTRVLLCKDGSLVLKSHSDSTPVSYTPDIEAGSRIVSIGVLPRFFVGREHMPKSAERARRNFTRHCDVPEPIDDPWTNGLMGIDGAGRLVVTGASETECRISRHPEINAPLESITLSATDDAATDRSYVPYGAKLRFKDGRALRIEANF